MNRRLVLAALLVACAASRADAVVPEGFLRQSKGVNNPNDIDEWRKGEDRGGLKPYPAGPPGAKNPGGGLTQFGGGSPSSYGSPDLGMPFAEWRSKMEKQRADVDKAAHAILEARYKLDCVEDKGGAKMSRGKALMVGPTGRLPDGVKSWDDYAAMSPDDIKKQGKFPYG